MPTIISMLNAMTGLSTAAESGAEDNTMIVAGMIGASARS